MLIEIAKNEDKIVMLFIIEHSFGASDHLGLFLISISLIMKLAFLPFFVMKINEACTCLKSRLT